MKRKRIANGIVSTILIIVTYSSAYAMQNDVGLRVIVTETDNEVSNMALEKDVPIVDSVNKAVMPVARVKRDTDKYSVLEGVYLGNNKIKVGSREVTIRSTKMSNAKVGDSVTLKVKGNINSFSIIDVTVNGVTVTPTKVVTRTLKHSTHQSGDFTLMGKYKQGYIHIEEGSKVRKVKLSIKNPETYEDKNVQVLVRGTIKSFSVKSIKLAK